MPRIILASQSPQRRDILKTLGVAFEVLPADIDEQAIQAATQAERAQLVARAKAEAVAAQVEDALIIAADTYVVDGQIALEKPRDLDEARAMLRQQSGQTLLELTGFCYLDQVKKFEYSTTVVTEMTFRELSEADIERYVKTEPVLTWSAAFCPAYPAGAALIAATNGSLTSFTHGLPIEEVVQQFKRSGAL